MSNLVAALSKELNLRADQIERTLALSEEGATVPFIARYRKEVTGGLDEVQIQQVIDRAAERRELEERRAAIVKSIGEQGRLTPELKKAIDAAATKSLLDDLYLPYRPKRRTRASMARERGLEPLADLIWKQMSIDRVSSVQAHVSSEKGVADAEAALAGAKDICAERIAEESSLRGLARSLAERHARLRSATVPAKRGQATKFDAYAAHEELLVNAPSHRLLAMLRGEAEEVLRVKLEFPDAETLAALTPRVVTRPSATFARELREAVTDAWERLVRPSLESELMAEAKERADREAIEVFGHNLRHLLLAPAAGARRIIAIDPGLRTGLKVAVLDATGALLKTATLYSERSADERARAAKQFIDVVKAATPDLIAAGNGTGSREAEKFVRECLSAAGKSVPVVSVSEQGASIYSASEVAREEFPDLDVSLRGAVSIGRRLADPLAELVKLDPKSIGVGQYQHDVDQKRLKKKLSEVVDSCVNAVGVELNTASPALLEHVSGLNAKVAHAVVAYRNQNGPFASRKALLKVPGLGKKTFEQAAGFLRVRGKNPLDASAVHPERYDIVETMADDLGVPLSTLVGNTELVRKIDWRRYVSDGLGEPTLRDILQELEKPGRDPRGDFSAPAFREDLQTLEDLREGMVLEGVVTNVTAFGAFVDVGVHQDGLVHVSQLAIRFVRDPAEVVKVGDRLKVKVISVDLPRRRLGLSVRAVLEGSKPPAPPRSDSPFAGLGKR